MNLFQCVAWTKMLIDYSEGRELSEAVEMTFDGNHPCSLCLAIEEVRDEQQDDPLPAPERPSERLDLFALEKVKCLPGRARLVAASPAGPGTFLGPQGGHFDLETPPPERSLA